jgi:hypothetical protein
MENLMARKTNPEFLGRYFYIVWRNHQWDKALIIGQEIRNNAIRENLPTKEIDIQIAMTNEHKEKAAKKKTAGL